MRIDFGLKVGESAFEEVVEVGCENGRKGNLAQNAVDGRQSDVPFYETCWR
jgi:hypothetical protein